MTSYNAQFGAKMTSTHGGNETVTRFWPVMEAMFTQDRFTADENGLRASGHVQLMSGTRVSNEGGTLKAQFEWATAGFGWWLRNILGTTGTSGPDAQGAYTHSGTVGDLLGSYFVSQVNAPLFPSGANQAMTLLGCKITKADFEIKPGAETVKFSPEIDYVSAVDSTTIASASYASSAPYVGFDVSTLTLGGTAINVDSLKISIDNKLKTKDHKLKTTGNQAQEQTIQGFREISVDIEADWYDLATWWNRYRASAAASTAAQLICTLTAADTGLTISTGTTQPSVTFTIPKLRVDKFGDLGPKSPGEGIKQKVTCVARYDGTNSPITISYISADSTA